MRPNHHSSLHIELKSRKRANQILTYRAFCNYPRTWLFLKLAPSYPTLGIRYHWYCWSSLLWPWLHHSKKTYHTSGCATRCLLWW